LNLNILKKNKLKSMSSKKVIFVLAGLILIAVLAAPKLMPAAEESQTIQRQEEKVTKGDIIVDMESDGVIKFSKVNLRFAIRGTIAEILANEGDKVNKGDIIARLEDEQYLDEYRLALAKLNDARDQELTNLLNDELKLEKTKTELEKLKDEYMEMEAIPDAYSTHEIKMKKSELDNKELEYENAVKTHQILVNNYENNEEDQNEVAVNIAKENLEDTILYAPVSGVLIHWDKKEGESVAEDQDIAVVHENNLVQAVTNVIEYDIGSIKLGQKVYISVEAIPDSVFIGEVSHIDVLPTKDSSGLVCYAVEIDVKNPGEELKDGMSCTASFVIKEVKNVLKVPYKAVKIVNGKQMVTVVDKNGEMVEKEIKTGFTDGSTVEVIEGLKVNDTVIVYSKSR